MTLVAFMPWVLSAFTVLTMILAGRKKHYTWKVGLFAQLLWLVWILASQSWGLLPMNAVLWVIYFRNDREWSRLAPAR